MALSEIEWNNLDRKSKLNAIENGEITNQKLIVEMAVSDDFWGFYSVLDRVTDEEALIQIALAADKYEYHKAVVKKITSEMALKKIADYWDAQGYTCFSSEEVHDWERESFHSHGWDYETWECKRCGKQADGGEWVDSR